LRMGCGHEAHPSAQHKQHKQKTLGLVFKQVAVHVLLKVFKYFYV